MWLKTEKIAKPKSTVTTGTANTCGAVHIIVHNCVHHKTQNSSDNINFYPT